MTQENNEMAANPIRLHEPQTIEDLVREGRMFIGPELAARVLEERNYERQRPRAKHGVTLWAEMLRRGGFTDGFQVWFGLLDGRLHLIDGQHRLGGVVEAATGATFQVEIMPLASADDLHVAYTCFDRVGRPRSLSEVLNALDVADRHGITKSVAREVFRAALLIHFKFDPPHQNVDPIAIRNDQERLKYAEPYWPVAAEYERLIHPAPAKVRARLKSSQIMAVALITLSQQPETARTFWSGLARNDGLRKGDARHTLLTWIGEHMFERTGYSGAVAASLAWSAFYERRSIETLKVGSAKGVRIAGTTYRKA